MPSGPGQTEVRLAPEAPPIVLTVLSTEEEFDWSLPFDPHAQSVLAARHIDRAQAVFDEHGVRPAYLVTHPIATKEDGYSVLKDIHDSDRCEIGAHLHPWVSPPIEEEISLSNSFPGNLPRELEASKVRTLADHIEQTFGKRPVSYQAGRYGFGPRTAEILREEGFEVDVSATPPYDFGAEGGPDFSETSVHPTWADASRQLLLVPVSGAYVGYLRRGAHRVYRAASALSWARAPGILARLGAVDRLRLSPEGFTADDNRRLVQFLYDQGVRVFVFSFHSPSVMPGCTTYVRDESDLAAFLDRCRRFYDFFLGDLGGRSLTPIELKRYLVDTAPGAP
jgi:hypothetical protein